MSELRPAFDLLPKSVFQNQPNSKTTHHYKGKPRKAIPNPVIPLISEKQVPGVTVLDFLWEAGREAVLCHSAVRAEVLQSLRAAGTATFQMLVLLSLWHDGKAMS